MHLKQSRRSIRRYLDLERIRKTGPDKTLNAAYSSLYLPPSAPPQYHPLAQKSYQAYSRYYLNTTCILQAPSGCAPVFFQQFQYLLTVLVQVEYLKLDNFFRNKRNRVKK